MSRHQLHSEARSGELFLQLSRLPAGLRCGWGCLCRPAADQAGPLQETSSGVKLGLHHLPHLCDLPWQPGLVCREGRGRGFPVSLPVSQVTPGLWGPGLGAATQTDRWEARLSLSCSWEMCTARLPGRDASWGLASGPGGRYLPASSSNQL